MKNKIKLKMKQVGNLNKESLKVTNNSNKFK